MILQEYENKEYTKEKEYAKAIDLIDGLKIHEIRDAKNILIKLKNDDKSCIDVSLSLAKTHQLLGDYDASIAELEGILNESDPSLCGLEYKSASEVKAWANELLGICYFKKGIYYKAEDYFLKAVQSDKAKDTDIIDPWFFLNLGIFYYKQRQEEASMKQFNKALLRIEKMRSLKSEENHSRGDLDYIEQTIKTYLSKIYYKQDEWNKSKKLVEESLEFFDKMQDNPYEELELASILIDQSKFLLDEEDYDGAKSCLNSASKKYESHWAYIKDLTPNFRSIEFENMSSLYNNLGMADYGLGNYDEAKKQFLKACEYKSKSATITNNLANVYAKKGDIERANSLYQQALKFKPDFKAARENIRLLSKKEPVCWWDWWFRCGPWIKNEEAKHRNICGKSAGDGLFRGLAGIGIFSILLLLLISVLIPITPMIAVGYTETNSTLFNNTIIPSASKLTLANLSSNVTMEDNVVNSTETEHSTSNNMSTDVETDGSNYKNATIMMTTTQTKGIISPEIKLLFAALLLLMLFQPQIRSFSAGSVKMDLEPIAVSKGPATNLMMEKM